MNQSTTGIDEQIRALVNQLFAKYDVGREGKLNIKQISDLFNDAFIKMNVKASIISTITEDNFRRIDKNFDGSASKEETAWGLRQYLIDNNLYQKCFGSQPTQPLNTGSGVSQPTTQNTQPPLTQASSTGTPNQSSSAKQASTGQQWAQPNLPWGPQPAQTGNTTNQTQQSAWSTQQPTVPVPTSTVSQPSQQSKQPNQPTNPATQPQPQPTTQYTQPQQQQTQQPNQQYTTNQGIPPQYPSPEVKQSTPNNPTNTTPQAWNATTQNPPPQNQWPTTNTNQPWQQPQSNIIHSNVQEGPPQWSQPANWSAPVPPTQQPPAQPWNQPNQQQWNQTPPVWNQPNQQQQWNQQPQQPNWNSQAQQPTWNQQPQQSWNQPQQPQQTWNQPQQPQQSWNQPQQQPWNNTGLPQPITAQTLALQWGNLQFKTTTDLKLKEAVDRIYLKYDIDHSGSLEPSEAAGAFNELMIELRIPATLNTQETLQLLQLVDRNKNGRIEKPEFFSCMKNLAGRDF